MRTITRSDLARGPVPVGDTESFAVGFKSPVPLFLYTYKGSTQKYLGCMAQDVAATRPECVSLDDTGHMAVDYSRLFGTGFEAGRGGARRDGMKAQNSLRATLGL